MERTLSSDTEESFKSIPGSIRNSLRHIDLMISTSVRFGSLDEIASTRRTTICFSWVGTQLTLSLDVRNHHRPTLEGENTQSRVLVQAGSRLRRTKICVTTKGLLIAIYFIAYRNNLVYSRSTIFCTLLSLFINLFSINLYKDYSFTDTVKSYDGSCHCPPIWELLRGFKRTWNTHF